MNFDHLPQFQIIDSVSEEYGEWVKKTAQLLKKPYISIAKIFEREKWSLSEIRMTYHTATNHCGKVTPEIAWWANRKRRNCKS